MQADLAELAGQVAQRLVDDLALPARQHRGDRAVVERGEPPGVEGLQSRDVRHQRLEHQRLDDQVVAAERVRRRQGCGVLFGQAVPGQQPGPQPLLVEVLGLVELRAQLVAERVDAAGQQHVEDRAQRDQLTGGEGVAVVDEQLQHQLQRRALPLQGAGDVDHRVQERRAERVHRPERGLVGAAALGVQERLPDLRLRTRDPLETGLDLGPCAFIFWLEEPLPDDLGQVRVGELDEVEPAVPVLEGVEQRGLLGARDVASHEFAQVPLPGHEADDRRGPPPVRGLHELGDHARLLGDERRLGEVGV